MRALILVDLDNVLDGTVADFASDAVRTLGRVKGTATAVVTAFAFNTTTALELTFEELRAASQRFQEALGGSKGHTEIALALTMPQAADVLLERLAREAPTEATSGPYELAVLFTTDGDLAEALTAQPAWKGWGKQFDEGKAGRCWRRGPQALPTIRKPPGPVRSGGGTEPNLDSVTIEISGGDGVAAWASRRQADIAPNATLKDLAQQAEREPWILSQVAATTKSLRGIGRMNALPTPDVPLLGPVSRTDGLEISGKGRSTGFGSQPAEASVGIGAIRFREPGITVPTLLPRGAFDDGRQHATGADAMAPERFLQRFAAGERISPASVRVEFRQRGNALIVKVVQEPMCQPKLWWIGKNTKAKSELRFDGRGLLPSCIRATAKAIRSPRDADFQVCLAADLDSTTTVSVPRRIEKGTLGVAVVVASDPPLEVAVLAMNVPVPAGVFSATPIQQLAGPVGQRNLPKELWSAPILVVR